MILEILLTLTLGLALSLFLALANNAIRSRIALRKYKKQLNNAIPFADEDQGLFSNHMLSFLSNENCQRFHARHQKYGDTIAGLFYEQLAIATTDLDFIKRVIIDEANVNINRVKINIPMKEWEKDCILLARDEQWRRIRKSFAPALRPRNFKTLNVVREIERTIGKLIGAIEQQLERHEPTRMVDGRAEKPSESGNKGLELDMDNVTRRISLDIVLSCLYKQHNIINFDLAQKCNWVEMFESIANEMRKNPAFLLGIIVPAIRHIIDIVIYYLLPLGKWRSDIMYFLKMQARDGLEARKQLALLQSHANGKTVDVNNFLLSDGREFKRNMIDHIVDQLHSGALTNDEFFNSSSFLFAAADKTSADALSCTLRELALNQTIQDKLRSSIRADGDESEYLAWVINESLRLNPPVILGPTRTISKAAELKPGIRIEAGTIILPLLYTIHRLPKYWGADADQFRPERWAQADSFHPAQFMPFGAGLRGCPGKEFALFELKMLLCALLERYKFDCRPNRRGPIRFDSPFLIYRANHSPIYLTIARA